MNNSIPNIILNQLGGSKFITMTGASNFVGDKNSLRMKLPRNGSKANYLRIELLPNDTYTMQFIKYTSPRFYSKTGKMSDAKTEVLMQYDNVYADQLQNLFTQYTKMYTHL